MILSKSIKQNQMLNCEKLKMQVLSIIIFVMVNNIFSTKSNYFSKSKNFDLNSFCQMIAETFEI